MHFAHQALAFVHPVSGMPLRVEAALDAAFTRALTLLGWALPTGDPP